jgi:putative FmdB family regulatory protein
MPIYDYLCLKCNEVFTVALSLAEIDKTKPTCPKCKSKKVKKQIVPFAFSHQDFQKELNIPLQGWSNLGFVFYFAIQNCYPFTVVNHS